MKIVSKQTIDGSPDQGYVNGFGYPIVDEVLEPYRGFIYLQETLMALCGKIVYGNSDMSDSEALQHADNFRKGMAKKVPEVLDELKVEFEEGCERKGIDKETTASLWVLIESSSGYVFNLSHAANYSLYTAQLAWFRFEYPIQFAAQRLNTKMNERDLWLKYCALNDIVVRPAKANVSTTEWQVENDEIIAPIQLIYGLANKSEKIVSKQPFDNVKDFDERLTGLECNSTNKLFLWLMGYFDGLEGEFDDLETPFEILENGTTTTVYRYKSLAQKRNDGKIKGRKNKETGKREEYVFVGNKEVVFELTTDFDFFLNFMNGAIFYPKPFADIVKKLDDAGFEVSFVTKVKEYEKGFELYLDGKLTIPKVRIYHWQIRKCKQLFVPEEKTYIAYRRSSEYRSSIQFDESKVEYVGRDGRTRTTNKLSNPQLMSIQKYLN